ncbi:TetR/AcrR family transcriptional regulator [Tsukamurella tyrosinosolvens]|uniref:TetR/AcrR family transcriptional regulator n=1 Tax=Tsukamurella tyrosinosolvens TaxID=57704 RepID=UPI002DD44E4D|nr:TetR/AcrR family transcriptional regulator [Tsukamurella tyrosinosolvens]MEC4615048.1 TetR/AcrR family transcriptional regulator [Tsukamurella tyrosinosolvens]
MPRSVDHEERRAQLADALARVAARDGLHAVSMRSVAAEAGVSLRLVQYYFTSKEQLLVGALRRLEEQSNSRWQARLARIGTDPTPRQVVDTFIEEALPTDGPSRDFYRVSTAFSGFASTEPALAAEPLAGGVGRLRATVAAAFDDAARAGDLVAGADPGLEADALVALCNGLSAAVAIGHHTPEHAVDVAQYHLSRLFQKH